MQKKIAAKKAKKAAASAKRREQEQAKKDAEEEEKKNAALKMTIGQATGSALPISGGIDGGPKSWVPFAVGGGAIILALLIFLPKKKY